VAGARVVVSLNSSESSVDLDFCEGVSSEEVCGVLILGVKTFAGWANEELILKRLMATRAMSRMFNRFLFMN
jgi:hypothetical protein